MCSTSFGRAVVPGGEVQQQRVARARRPVGHELGRRVVGERVVEPAVRDAVADRDPRVVARARRRTSPASAARTTTCLALPRSMRSRRSLSASSVVAGITTAPSFIAASIVSHSSTWLPSISTIRSPRATPCARSQFASWSERVDQLGERQRPRRPVRLDDQQPDRRRCRARTPSNQSSAQLNSSSAGHANDAQAASQSSRFSSSPSRRALSASMRADITPRSRAVA